MFLEAFEEMIILNIDLFDDHYFCNSLIPLVCWSSSMDAVVRRKFAPKCSWLRFAECIGCQSWP